MPICSCFAVHHVDMLSLSSRSWANSLILTIKTFLRGLLATWILVLTLFGLLGGPKLTQDFYWGQHSASLNILGCNFRWALGKIHVCKVCLKWEAWNGWRGRDKSSLSYILYLHVPSWPFHLYPSLMSYILLPSWPSASGIHLLFTVSRWKLGFPFSPSWPHRRTTPIPHCHITAKIYYQCHSSSLLRSEPQDSSEFA